MFFAHTDRLNYRWYYGFKLHDDDTITVIIHDRIPQGGDGHPVSAGEYKSIESPKRILQALIINNRRYKVNNPDHVFSYSKFDGGHYSDHKN